MTMTQRKAHPPEGGYKCPGCGSLDFGKSGPKYHAYKFTHEYGSWWNYCAACVPKEYTCPKCGSSECGFKQQRSGQRWRICSKCTGGPAHKPWTEQQVETLKSLYTSGYALDVIARRVQHPASSMCVKASLLGLYRPPNPASDIPRLCDKCLVAAGATVTGTYIPMPCQKHRRDRVAA